MAKKVDTVSVGFRWKREVLDMVKQDAEEAGVTLGSYLSMIASQKHIEKEAMRMVSHIPPDKLRQMLMEKEEE